MLQKCENCGNQYDKAFKVIMQEKEYTFDCFECAINSLAPYCHHCDSRIIGHGVEAYNRVYCCVHCAKAENEKGLIDRVSQ
ncbi:MAG: hypothetical protein AB7O96_16535 [Pseudobdellovibrionaceae bacterium]